MLYVTWGLAYYIKAFLQAYIYYLIERCLLLSGAPGGTLNECLHIQCGLRILVLLRMAPHKTTSLVSCRKSRPLNRTAGMFLCVISLLRRQSDLFSWQKSSDSDGVAWPLLIKLLYPASPSHHLHKNWMGGCGERTLWSPQIWQGWLEF